MPPSLVTDDTFPLRLQEDRSTKGGSFFYEIMKSPDTGTIPLQESEDKLPVTVRTYKHPEWKDWRKIWETPPVVIDPKLFHPITPERAFCSALFRLVLREEEICDSYKQYSLQQGTTIDIKGFENPHGRFVVEWNQWVGNHKAHVKVVGYDEQGETFSYNDQVFPSFMLIVPICIAHGVSIPKPIISRIDFDGYGTKYWDDEETEEKSCKMCITWT
jgi:hypothetical protein